MTYFVTLLFSAQLKILQPHYLPVFPAIARVPLACFTSMVKSGNLHLARAVLAKMDRSNVLTKCVHQSTATGPFSKRVSAAQFVQVSLTRGITFNL